MRTDEEIREMIDFYGDQRANVYENSIESDEYASPEELLKAAKYQMIVQTLAWARENREHISDEDEKKVY